MTTQKLSAAMKALSNDAKAVGAAWFGMMVPGGESRLVFHMQESRPTARAQAGLDELVAAGIISREPYNQFGSVKYEPLVDCRPLFAWSYSRLSDPSLSFTLTEPIPAGRAALAGEKP